MYINLKIDPDTHAMVATNKHGELYLVEDIANISKGICLVLNPVERHGNLFQDDGNRVPISILMAKVPQDNSYRLLE